jgi:pyruvate,orthophosphate dikinase
VLKQGRRWLTAPLLSVLVLQARAILEAAVNVTKEGVKVHPHIMIPLVGIEDELVGQAKIVKEIAEQVGPAALPFVAYQQQSL